MKSASRNHSDRDEVRRRAEDDFLNLYLEHGGAQRWKKQLRCLFHEDKTPSASIFKGRFHCFGCGINLDVFEFIQRIRGEDFMGALAFLAARYSVPLNSTTLNEAERREHARRWATAEAEAGELVEWKRLMLDTLRECRNIHLAAYHRAVQYIFRNGLDAPAGNLAADTAELFEARYQALDRAIERLEWAPYAELLPLFRARPRWVI
jgi:DNA primase